MEISSVEQGLHKLCETWNNVSGLIMASAGNEIARFNFLNKRFNCEIKDGDCFTLAIKPDGAELDKGRDEFAHATISMDKEDWLKVLAGDYSLWSVMIAGRLEADLHESQLIITLGYLINSIALMEE